MSLYREGVDVLGDSASDAQLATGLTAALLRAGGGIAAQHQAGKEKEAAEKKAADAAKAAWDAAAAKASAAAAPAENANKAATAAREKAALSGAAAKAAAAKSAASPADEKLKKAAEEAAKTAVNDAADAAAASEIAAYYNTVASGVQPSAQQQFAMQAAVAKVGDTGGMNTTTKVLLGVGGVMALGFGFLGYRMIRRK